MPREADQRRSFQIQSIIVTFNFERSKPVKFLKALFHEYALRSLSLAPFTNPIPTRTAGVFSNLTSSTRTAGVFTNLTSSTRIAGGVATLSSGALRARTSPLIGNKPSQVMPSTPRVQVVLEAGHSPPSSLRLRQVLLLDQLL